MTDYNTYLDGLMAACRQSVQSPSSRPQYPHVPPLPNPFRISLKEPQRRPGISTDRRAIEAAGAIDMSRKVQHAATVSRHDVHKNLPPAQSAPGSGSSTDRPGIEAAGAVDTSGKIQHAATASRSDVHKNLSPAQNAPRPRVSKILMPPTATTHADVDRIVPPPPAYAPHYAIPTKHFPETTAPSPFAPIFQLPIENSTSAHGPQKANEPVTPSCHIESENTKCEDHMKDEPDKTSPLRYKNMPQRAMREELKRRGLYSGGPNPDLVKRLEQDDAFQAKQRTAENYDTMDPKDIHSLCATRSIPSQGTTSLLRDRLKAHDKRENRKEPAAPRLSPVISPSGHLPLLETKASRRMLDERPLVPTAKDEPASMTETAEDVGGTLATAKSMKSTGSKMMHDMLPKTIHRACEDCQKGHRRCRHDMNGNEDPTLDTEVVARKNPTKLRLSNPRETASQNDEKPSLAVEERAGRRVTRIRMSIPKVAVSRDELRRSADNGRVIKGVERNTDASNVRRKPVLFQPKDEISLLQICVKLKEVIAWGKISGFWNMVEDTLQLKTGKDYKRVNRHVKILVGKRRAEQRELEQRGKIVKSRVSAGCRPLLDKWIAGGKREHHPSPKTSKKPVIREDEEDTSLGEETSQQPDSDDSALGVQKRSATDAWLDNSCDTTRSKKFKLSTSELTPVSSTSHADSVGCWSLSGSSVTSESSLEDEDEDEDEDDVKSGKY